MSGYRIFWLIAFLALIAIGSFGRERSTRSWPMIDRGPNSAVNTALAVMARSSAPDVTQQITHWLDSLPPDRPLLILGAPDNVAALVTTDLISYISWPRAAHVSCGSFEHSATLMLEFPEKYGAVALCHIAPSSQLPNSKRLGPALTLISAEKRSE